MAAGELWVQSTALRWHAGGATIGSSVGTDDGGDAGVDGHLWIEATKIGYIDDNTDPRMIEGNPYCAVYCGTDDESENAIADNGYDADNDSTVQGGHDETHVSGADGSVEVGHDSSVDGDDDASANATNDASVAGDDCGVDCATYYSGNNPTADGAAQVGEDSGANGFECSTDNNPNYTGVEILGVP